MATSTTLASPSILQNLYWDNLNKLNMAQADRDAAKAQVAGVAAVMDRYDASVVTVNTNGDLSAQGRASALLAAGKRGLDQLASLTAPTLASLDEQIVSLSRALRRAASGPDATLVTELRAIETRAAFGQLDPLFQQGNYLALCGNGLNDAACIAIEQTGAFAPSPAADVLDTASDLRALLLAAVATARKHMSVAVTGGDPMQVANAKAADLDEA